MRIFLILLFIITISCKREEKQKFQQSTEFQKIDTSRRFKYFLSKKIIPNKEYKYWQYKRASGTIGKPASIVSEAGDTLFRKLINQKLEIYEGYGVPGLGGGHPYGPQVYVVTVENQKINLIKSAAEFRTFLGTIDNLEEALLFAKTYGYFPNGIRKGNEYRKVKDDFELHLTGFNKTDQMEYVLVKITKNGFIKTESLGFCEKSDCSKD